MAKSLAKIVGSFHKTKKELNDFIGRTQSKIQDKGHEIDAAQMELTDLKIEQQHAAKIVENIETFLGEAATE